MKDRGFFSLDGHARFTAVAKEIWEVTGKEENKEEIASIPDKGRRQLLKYNRKTSSEYVRFNIVFL